MKKPEAAPPPQSKLEQWRRRQRRALEGVAPLKAKNRLPARERLHYLLDEGSFEETDLFVKTRETRFGLQEKAVWGDGVVTGFGAVNGRGVCVYAQDFAVLGGSLGAAHAQKICKIMDWAFQNRMPLIGLLDSGGARIQEGVDALDGYAQIFRRNVRYSGVIPQISVILGPCAGGAVYSPALTDFIFMVEGLSHMFVTGPDVLKAATSEEVTFEDLGGARAHVERSGVCHVAAKSEPDCFRQVRELLSYLPSSSFETPPARANPDPEDRPTPEFEKVCELDGRKPYRAHQLIWDLADEHKFFEIQSGFALNVVAGFMRLGGQSVGVIANNPAHLAGAITIDSADKTARFIRFLNAFHIPLLTLTDVPGYLPGLQQEHGGIIRHGAKVLYAYAEAEIPLVTLVLRKAYGGAYIAMGSKYLGADFNFALPSAEVAVMGAEGAVEILFSKDLARLADPQKKERRLQLVREYAELFSTPYAAAASGSLDQILEPSRVRLSLIKAFRFLKGKPAAAAGRGNMPL